MAFSGTQLANVRSPQGYSAGSAESGGADAMTPAVIVSGALFLSLSSGPRVKFGLSALARTQASQLAWGIRVVQ